MSKKTAFIIFAVCMMLIVVIVIGAADSGKRQREAYAKKYEKNNVAEMFEGVGFTKESAEHLAKIFENVGITYISHIKKGPGTGINELQTYTCRIYDRKTETLTFTFEKSRLVHIELNGSLFEQGELHTVLYDDGDYKYKVDYKNGRIIKIE